jgi:hypothetical protein
LAGALVVMLAGTGRPHPAARFQQAWAAVSGEDEPWGRFLPGSEPYAPGCGPGVGERVRGLKTAQGEPIDTLDLVGWKEGDAWRIVVYAMLAGAPGPAANSACDDSRRRREIASVHVPAGREAVLEQMKTIGARPWRVAVVLR